MTTKEQLKNLIDQLPEEKTVLIESILENLLQQKQLKPPTGKLGIKKHFNRRTLYNEILVNRY